MREDTEAAVAMKFPRPDPIRRVVRPTLRGFSLLGKLNPGGGELAGIHPGASLARIKAEIGPIKVHMDMSWKYDMTGFSRRDLQERKTVVKQ